MSLFVGNHGRRVSRRILDLDRLADLLLDPELATFRRGDVREDGVQAQRGGTERFYDAVRALPHRERAILRLACVDGLSYAEISEQLGMAKDETLRSIRDALEALHRHLPPNRRRAAR